MNLTQPKLRMAAAVLAATLAVPALTSCDALSTAMDCANTAVAIANSVDNLQQAVSNAGNSVQDTQNALNQIDTDLKKIKDQTGNADLGKAVDSMSTAVRNVRTSIEQGNAAPDIKPVADAAAEISKVCTPG
ncbi:hypothetical protein WDV06_08710 [Streptomyces racemochromogenes]|uniref:Secreted protein n=1 Tax=Streptomyces racemochromogenes TaxID=67353 RepID=A0ABW7P9Z6_9ACTN